MERIAFIYGSTFVYWSAIVLALAALTSVLLFWGLYLDRSGNLLAAAVAVPLAILLSVLFSRLLHWYCRPNSYDSLAAALTELSGGGYALAGVFAGCAAAAAVLRLLRISRNLPQMLDCMSLAGLSGIAVGRLASFFNASDRGQILGSLRSLPLAYPVVNVISGEPEYRLATFVLQSIAAGVLLIALLASDWIRGRRGRRRDGDTCLLFLLCYGASQIVLDSTRYDSLFFRSNGFVSVVQVLGLAGVVLAMVVFSVRMVRTRGFRGWYAGLWVLMAALLGGAGFMEYFVQRHASKAPLAYSVMSLCFAAAIGLTIVAWAQCGKPGSAAGKYPSES